MPQRWTVPKIWPDATTYVLGGGPSLPDKDYLEPLLNDKRIIGVNDAYRYGPWVDVCWFGDCRWYTWHKKALLDFPGLKATCCNRCENEPGIKYLKKSGKRFGIETRTGQISWNLSSGASAINLAVLFGAKRIVLLGFDMKHVEGRSNWHNSHQQAGSIRHPYQRFLTVFPHIKTDLDKLGVECVNATPGSALDAFESVNLMEEISRQADVAINEEVE